MPKVFIEIEQKRPKDATPERAMQLRAAGLSVIEIAKLWGCSRAAVYQQLKKVDGPQRLSKEPAREPEGTAIAPKAG